MRVRLLGTAAGGGFPQWNCGCANCRAVRDRAPQHVRRSQCSVAFSGDGERWFLLNASPDLRARIEAFPALWPPSGQLRGTPIEGVLLTNGDLDKVLGLWLLREGGPTPVYATQRLRESLELGLRMPSALACYGGVEWREPSADLRALRDSVGQPSGLAYAAFPVPGKPPRYLEGKIAPALGDNVGYRIVDEVTGSRLIFIPDLAAIDDVVLAQLASCDALLVDGTFWTEREMASVGGRPASAMAHLPVSGAGGTLARLRELEIPIKLFVHVNNTNPMLRDDSPEALAAAGAGFEVARDGKELFL